MFKVSFQVHGAVDIREKMFNTYSGARMWCDAHNEVFSFSFIQKAFH